jgi:NAD(P)-dependent dehydrogenase (short-subunit alcohol dehydrogenase family)
MPQNIFINDVSYPLTSELVKTLTNDGHNLFSTHDPEDKDIQSANSVSLFKWEKSSPVSARSVMVNLLKQAKIVDRAILIFRPSGINEAFHTISTSMIDMELDSSFRGLVYMTKILLNQFIKQGKGSLTFVIHTDGALVQTPLCAATIGAYRGLAGSLFMQYEKQNLELSGFYSDTAKSADFCAFIAECLGKKASRYAFKWNEYGKKGLFSN